MIDEAHRDRDLVPQGGITATATIAVAVAVVVAATATAKLIVETMSIERKLIRFRCAAIKAIRLRFILRRDIHPILCRDIRHRTIQRSNRDISQAMFPIHRTTLQCIKTQRTTHRFPIMIRIIHFLIELFDRKRLNEDDKNPIHEIGCILRF